MAKKGAVARIRECRATVTSPNDALLIVMFSVKRTEKARRTRASVGVAVASRLRKRDSTKLPRLLVQAWRKVMRMG